MKYAYLSIGVALSLFGITACGGGSGSSTSSTVTTPVVAAPPVSTNAAPTAVASSASSTLTEGEQIMLSASSSSDADGDALTFTWVQVSGPNVLPGGTVSATNLTVSSLDVDVDTVLTFELSASDGIDTATDTVSVTVEPFGFQDTDEIFSSIIASAANTYTLFFGTQGIGDFNFGTQEFSADATPIGAQVSGSLSAGDIEGNFFTGLQEVIQSGTTVYNIFSSQLDIDGFGGPEEILLSTIRGPINQDFPNIGDIYAQVGASAQFLAFDATAVGTDQLATISIAPSESAARDVVAHVVNPDGSLMSSSTLADGAPFAGSSVIASVDSNSYAGFWVANNQINIQFVDLDGSFLGSRVNLDPISSEAFEIFDVAVESLANNQLMIVAGEAQNVSATGSAFPDPIITVRVVDASGALVVSPIEIGQGTEPTALTLNDGNVLVVWDGHDDGLVARIITPTGEFASDVHVLSPERIIGTLDPVQLEGGNVLIADGVLARILNFPVNLLDFFPLASQ